MSQDFLFQRNVNKKMGNTTSSDRDMNSRSVQTIYNSAVVSMAQNCDSRVGNSIIIEISGDNNVIDGVWLDQSISWSNECIATFFNTNEFYNTMTSQFEDLASTGQKNLELGPIKIPMPEFGTKTTVNTEQIMTATTRMLTQFNQECRQDVNNYIEFSVSGNFNTVGNVSINQTVDSMSSCFMNGQNQNKVTNDLLASVKGATDSSLSIWGWVVLAVIIAVIVIIVVVIIVAITRASSKKSNPSDSENTQSSEEQPTLSEYTTTTEQPLNS